LNKPLNQPDNPQPEISGAPRRLILSKIWNVLKFVLALFLLGFVLSRTDVRQLAALRTRIALNWLVVSFGIYVLMTLIRSAQYFLLSGRRVSYPRVLYIVILQNTISSFIANSAGVASYIAMFRAENIKLGRSTVSFIVAKVGDLISVWLLLLISSIGVWPQVKILHEIIVILLISIGALLVAFWGAVILRQHFMVFLRRILAWLHLERYEWMLKGMNFLQVVADQEPLLIFRMVSLALLYSFVYMLLSIAWGYANLRMFSIDLVVMPIVFVTMLTQLLSIIPIQIFGGLGVIDASLMFFYSLFGFAQNELAAVLLGLRLIAYAMNAVLLLYVPFFSVFKNAFNGSGLDA
jgi:uncharacterized membrane protein YbhN (UPF0104 family)